MKLNLVLKGQLGVLDPRHDSAGESDPQTTVRIFVHSCFLFKLVREHDIVNLTNTFGSVARNGELRYVRGNRIDLPVSITSRSDQDINCIPKAQD